MIIAFLRPQLQALALYEQDFILFYLFISLYFYSLAYNEAVCSSVKGDRVSSGLSPQKKSGNQMKVQTPSFQSSSSSLRVKPFP